LKAVVLEAAAGGGFPQWNSNAEARRQAPADDGHVVRRTQASLAVGGEGERWFPINASPDLRQSISIATAIAPVDRLGASQLAAAARHWVGQLIGIAVCIPNRDRELDAVPVLLQPARCRI
jgi:coenzyme PQQ biosynthesis protein B